MPELPEVETMVRGIRPTVAGSVIVAMKKSPCRCKPIVTHPAQFQSIQSRLRSRQVIEITRLGKRILWKIDTGDVLVIEPRMTGLMVLENPPDKEHLRVHWQLYRGRKKRDVWFWDRRGLGQIALYTSVEFEQKYLTGHLGQDALEMSLKEWYLRCDSSRREVKVALLDQKWIAGIGNIYASEILHKAGIHPLRPTNSLTKLQIQRLRQCTLKILNMAIKYEGSTLNDATYRNALNQSGQYQNHHRVYNNQGKTCKTCRGCQIVKIVQAQRATYFCPVCQPAS